MKEGAGLCVDRFALLNLSSVRTTARPAQPIVFYSGRKNSRVSIDSLRNLGAIYVAEGMVRIF